MGEILNINLKHLYACKHGISEREGGYFKGTAFSPVFHISNLHRAIISLQGTYANFCHHSNLPQLTSLSLSISVPLPESHIT